MSREKATLRYHLYQWLWVGFDLIFPPHCAGCGCTGTHWCQSCQSETVLFSEPLCEICGSPQPEQGVCPVCRINPPYYDRAFSFAAYDTPLRKAIIRLKYHGDGGLGEKLSFFLLHLIRSRNLEFDLVVPVPLGKKRLKERGYNQSSFLARPISLYYGLCYVPGAIQRIRETRSQVGLDSESRRANVKDAFAAQARWVQGRSVLLVDDVFTTGSTIAACAKALKESGAHKVFGLTLARAAGPQGDLLDPV